MKNSAEVRRAFFAVILMVYAKSNYKDFLKNSEYKIFHDIEKLNRGDCEKLMGDVIGISPGSIRNKLKGRSEFELGEARKLCDFFNIKIEEFIDALKIFKEI